MPSRHARPTLSAMMTPIRGARTPTSASLSPSPSPSAPARASPPVPEPAAWSGGAAAPGFAAVSVSAFGRGSGSASASESVSARAARRRGERGAETRGGGVRVFREQQQVVVLLVVLDVRHVGSGVRENEAVAGLHDEDAGDRTQHLDRFAQDRLDRPRILPGAGRQLGRPRRRNHPGEPHCPSFRLGHDLLRDHHHVAVVQRFARARERAQQESGQVVAGPDPGREPRERPDVQFVRRHAALLASRQPDDVSRARGFAFVTPPGAP